MKKRVYLRFISTIAMLASMISIAFGAASTTAQAAALPYSPHPVQVNPVILKTGQGNAQYQFACQAPTAAVRCYSPQQIRAAYSIQPVLNKGITGKGSTIVIVDAYQSPTVQQDLDKFDTTFGLASTTVNIIAPDGLTPFDSADPNQLGWAEEISLDVQWSHAVAPGATIDLVLAKSNQDADLLSVTKYAVEHSLGDVISQSFGEAESCADPKLLVAEHKVFEAAALKHITVFASSGDQGAAQPTCDNSSYILSASTPASDPLVTGVGGTHLDADATTGKYIGETVWNDAFGASGGGYSTIYKRPFYQLGTVKSQWRGVPDVSYSADVNGGVLTVLGFLGTNSGIYIFGGTSAGSPQWAAITALAVQKVHHRVGFINPILYAIGHSRDAYQDKFHDIVSGNNTFVGTDASGNPVTITGYSAGKGWDATTGWGSPIVSQLLSFGW
ncbi:MAG: S53 family peptidase [Ktedonobacteraceae bacterium]|nr:S53 family peptidase [Ktedonobacteraceae bacterium]